MLFNGNQVEGGVNGEQGGKQGHEEDVDNLHHTHEPTPKSGGLRWLLKKMTSQAVNEIQGTDITKPSQSTSCSYEQQTPCQDPDMFQYKGDGKSERYPFGENRRG